MSAPTWLKDRIAHHVLQLWLLSRKPDHERVTCPVCGGDPVAANRADLCGCGGTMTVMDARKHHDVELEILNR